jgi:hypothetical protein
VLVGSSFGGLISTMSLWDGAGRLAVDTLLILAVLAVVITVAGYRPSMESTTRQSRAHGETPAIARRGIDTRWLLP